jgi:hypothetical protein
MVLEALRLLAGIFLRHDPEQSKIAEIQIYKYVNVKWEDICLRRREAK